MPAPRDTDTGGPRRRRRPRPSAAQRARAQQQGYVSQGQAVQRAATQAQPRPSGPSFAEPFRKPRGLQRQQVKARDRTRRAEKRLPDTPLIPHVPLLRNYTPRQRQAVRQTYRRAARQAGAGSVTSLYLLGSPRQRQQMRRVGRAVTFGDQQDDLRPLRERNRLDTVAPRQRSGRTLKDTLTAGPTPGQGLFSIGEAKGILASIFNVGRATYEDPVAVGKTSVRTGVESIAGIPEGVKVIADNPVKGIEAIVKDYEDRYGSVLDDPKAFRERVKKDWGLTPYALDAAAAAGGTGQAAGLLARSGAFAKAARAFAEAEHAPPGVRAVGRAGQAVNRAATEPRPLLREFAGEAGAREQPVSRNLLVAGTQRTLDRARRRAYTRRVEHAGLEDAGGGQLRARPGVETAKRIAALRPGEGEVLPLGGLREMPMLRRLTGRVARDVGGIKSTTRPRLLARRGRALRDVNRQVDQLDPNEKRALKYVMKYGLPAGHDIGASVKALQRKLAQIKRARKEAGFKGTSIALRDVADDAASIRTILKDPEAHLTTRVRKVADELRQVQRREEVTDPDLTPERALIRQDRPQAALLGVERGPDSEHFLGVMDALETAMRSGREDPLAALPPGILRRYGTELAQLLPESRTGRALELEAAARQGASAAGRDVETARRRAAVMSNVIRERERRGPPLSTEATRGAQEELARANREARRLRTERDRLMGESKGARVEAQRVPGVRYGPDFRRTDRAAALTDVRQRLGAAEQRVKQARAAVRQTEKTAPRIKQEMRDRLAQLEADVKLSRESRDAARQLHKIARTVTRTTRRKETMRLESAAAFDAKVRAAAEEAGLQDPAYWMSSPRPREERSLAALGTGGRAVAKTKRYQGKLDRLGIEETGPDALTRGIERNIKRRFSWALVARNMEVHAFEWSRGHAGGGRTAGELLRELDDRAIDPSTVAFISPKIARRRGLEEQGVERGAVIDSEVDPEAVDTGLDVEAVREVHEDLLSARRSVADLQNEEVQGQALNRYLAVPREVADELEHATAPDGALARSLQIVLNQKPARILLGTLNAPWLTFQVASNAFLTGIGGGKNVLDIYGAHKFWRGLTEAQRDAWEAELGITHGHHWGIDQAHLGSTKEKMGAAKHLVNFWQAYKATRVGRMVHKANPLDFMFRVDETQNNFFRRVLFYNQAKRAAYKRMGASWRSIDGLQGKLSSVLGLPPEHMAAGIAEHAADFETHAKHVRAFLGDYLRYSDQERRLLGRNVMFYGYLRFSLRFAFYTMPVQHPIMSAILGDIGRMGAQEIKDLFGVPETYRLPTTMLAGLYYGNRRDAKTGKLRQIPIGRFNPFLNSVTQLESEQQLIGLLSPIYQDLADQFFEESSFTGRDFRIKGIPTPAESERPKNYFGSIYGAAIPGRPRNRILLRNLLNLTYPYRVAEKLTLHGPQSDDALAFSPRPMQYVDPATKRSIARSVRQEKQRGVGPLLLDQAIPLLRPQLTRAPDVIAREREKEAAAAETERRSKLSPSARAALEKRNRSRAAKKAARTRRARGGNAGYGGSSGGSGYGGSSGGAGRYGG